MGNFVNFKLGSKIMDSVKITTVLTYVCMWTGVYSFTLDFSIMARILVRTM